jgi:glucose-6-phosphate isomerase
VAGRLLGINPFDQPDVESAKQAARGLLDARPEGTPPDFTDGAVEVRDAAEGATDLASAVRSLLDRLPERGYVAVMAYLDPDRDAALTGSRALLAARTGRPATFGWGPRFLHSTGQYHKGGPPVGVYVQVTAAALTDLEIPDRPFTFGQLVSAQAAGDAQVLADSGRPVLRLHLTDPDAGVRQILEVLR